VAKTPAIRYGGIVWADVNDPITKQPAGEHPVVILTTDAEIAAKKQLVGAVCSTSFGKELPSGWFPMPTKPGPGGDPITGLTEACVVKSTWIEPILKINRFAKRCPRRIVRQVEDWLRDKRPKKS
jgi:mRNA-degrading endonuclease toxin of MazEF toxin-antitoxin module